MDGSSLTKGGGTATDLRIAILDAFEEAGIASPFLRTDVTLRNIDWLRGIVADYDSDSLQRKGVSHREVSFRNVTKKVCDAPWRKSPYVRRSAPSTASRCLDGQEPKMGAGNPLTVLRYRPECLGTGPTGISMLHRSQIFSQCHIVGPISWSDCDVFSRLGAHHDHQELDIE
jgi:hypothetical protein